MIHYAWMTHVGYIRERNEDNLCCLGITLPQIHTNTDPVESGFCEPGPDAVFSLFDGMGGESRGDVASWIAAQTCAEYFQQIDQTDSASAIKESILEQNRAVCAYARRKRVASMGSTAALLWFQQDKVTAANVGDSRIFRMRSGKLTKISEDHTYSLIPGQKGWLTQHLGIPEDEMILNPFVTENTTAEGDQYLLCSDGLTDLVTEEEIRSVLANTDGEGKTAEDKVNYLCRLALNRGGIDNITMILCEIV